MNDETIANFRTVAINASVAKLERFRLVIFRLIECQIECKKVSTVVGNENTNPSSSGLLYLNLKPSWNNWKQHYLLWLFDDSTLR